MKQKKLFSGLLAALFLVGCMATTASAFTDDASIKNTDAVTNAVELGIINGRDTGEFDPAGPVTRAEMAKMISVIMTGGKVANPTGTATFTDTADHWAVGFVAYCADQGIIAGMGDGTFGPEDRVTGEQAAKMLMVVLGYNPETEGYTGETWAAAVMTGAINAKLFENLSDLDAKADLTRDDAAQMIWNALNAEMVEYVEKADDAAAGDDAKDEDAKDDEKKDDAKDDAKDDTKTDDTKDEDAKDDDKDDDKTEEPVLVRQSTGKTLLEVKFGIAPGGADADAEGEDGEEEKTEGDDKEEETK